MEARPIRIRRGRRTDFTAVMELLGASGTPVPAPDRTTLRRFRQIVADLGCDLYLATIDERVVGLAHVTYARQLAAGPLATLAQLVVAEAWRRRGVGRALLQFATTRARQRACTGLRCALTADDPRAGQFAQASGARPAGQLLDLPVPQDGATGG